MYRKNFDNVKKILNIDSEKSLNSFKRKNDWIVLFIGQFYFYYSVNNFSELLICKMNIFEFLKLLIFFQIF